MIGDKDDYLFVMSYSIQILVDRVDCTGYAGNMSDKPLEQCGNRILKAFANSLDPDETPQNVVSHLDPNCTINKNSVFGTQVEGLSNLYACSLDECENNLEYRITGSDSFFLETYSQNGHVQLSIHSKGPLSIEQASYHFIIIAENSDGQQGHTNVEVNILATHHTLDTNLRFRPSDQTLHRHRRQTAETNPDQSVMETASGQLFSVAVAGSPNYRYSLKSSTYKNAFTVSVTGAVSVAPGFKLDYETYVPANNGSNRIRLEITVTDSTLPQGNIVKEILQPVILLDVNDENPVFTNEFVPYLATVALNSPANTLVYSLTASDPDEKANIQLEKVMDGSSDTYFEVVIVGNRADIKRTGAVPFQNNQQLNITVRATDRNGNTTQVTSATVQILVGSRAPQFKLEQFTYRFQEDNAVNQRITTDLNRIKVRSFQNNAVIFSILDGNSQVSNLFEGRLVAQTSGDVKECDLYVLRSMDYEVDPKNFSLSIKVTEASTGLSSTVPMVVQLTDKNEFNPRFSISTYKKENVPENITVGAVLLQVMATDQDLNSKIAFSVNNDHFRVQAVDPNRMENPYTADIIVNKALDYDSLQVKLYDFTVTATDNGDIQRTGDATVRIFLTNVNDEKPVFTENMTADVRYNAPVETEIYQAKATDADGDGVKYRFVSNYPKFQIDQNSGRVVLQQKIADSQAQITDFEYRLGIIATDDGACCGSTQTQSSTSTLTVNILTDNAVRPSFDNCQLLNPKVKEEVTGATVIQVSATDTDYGKNGKVTYSIREQNVQFVINSTSGVITTSEKIDREKLTGSKISINVIGEDGGGLQGTCPLLIQIEDINDNAPVFGPLNAFKVLKTASVGTIVDTVEATDADISSNGQIVYSLVSNPGNYFRIDDNGKYTGTIRVNQTLPQNLNVLTIRVQAADQGTPPLFSNVTINVSLVEEANALPPVWLDPEESYTVTVAENISIANALLTFTAQSRNASLPTLSFGLLDDFGKLFTASSNAASGLNQTGALRLLTNLDYEKATVYSVTLLATDVKNQRSSKKCTINVKDVNDVTPTFLGIDEESNFLELKLLEGDYTTRPNAGQIVDTIRATDGDGTSPNNLIVKYEIFSDLSGKFTINSLTGVLSTKAVFDRELENVYTISVKAIDGAPSALTSDGSSNTGLVTVKITIQDVNDNIPTFEKTLYNFDVAEDTIIGKSVARVTATDRDSDAVLSYSIRSGSSNVPFAIVAQTGDIYVAGEIDYDQGQRVYTMSVQVSDSIFINSTNVTINILDSNDNPPVVQDYSYTNITENDNSVVGKLVTIKVTDKDNDGVNTFFYSLRFSDSLSQNFFAISSNGDLSIIKALDRDFPDGLAEFKFTVEVRDAPLDKNPLYGYGEVTIRPIDVNDKAPEFPTEAMQMTVREELRPPVDLGKVGVVDYDDPLLDNSKFDLEIISQSPEPNQVHFTLSGTSIQTNSILDRERVDKYFLTMKAVDRGTPKQTGSGTLTITVEDYNDNAPKFNQTYRFVLSEHQREGEVGRIQAFDADIGVNAELTYSLDDASFTYFEMNQDRKTNQGVLTIFKPVDYDDLDNLQRNFNLTAIVVDADPNHKDQTSIQIIVTDYNDEVPTFDKAQKSVTVAENMAVGTSVAHFNATDRDVNPEYKKFEYYIAKATDKTKRFRINQNGEVFIENPLDYETTPTHILHILAIDNVNGSPQNTGTATLTVTVTDINDNYPDFAQKELTGNLMENQQYNDEEILTITATDADGPNNGEPFQFGLNCSYQGGSPQCNCQLSGSGCPSGSNNRFSLTVDTAGDGNRGTAKLRVTGKFDSEFERVVKLPIWMCDLRGLNRLDHQCGIRYLNIKINDKNDNTHRDGTQSITVHNYKGLFGNFVIGKVNSFDLDEIDDDKVYTLMDEALAGKFVRIDPTNGEITLKPKVPEMSFEFKVGVKDQNNVGKTTTVRVTVIYVTEDAVFNSGSVRINGISPAEFLRREPVQGSSTLYEDSAYIKFQKLLAKKLYGSDSQPDMEKVQMVSVMGNASYTDVRFAAHGSPWYQSSRLDGIVTQNRAKFQSDLSDTPATKAAKIDMVPIDMCRFETCEGGGCFNELVVKDTPVNVGSGASSYVGVNTNVLGSCGCRATNFSGEIKCTPGYCYHGGQCVLDNWGVVSCKCPDGFEGPRCQKLRQSFNGTGYALYKQLEQCAASRTSIEILTSKLNQLILYNGPISVLEPVDPTDFVLLELVDGYPRLRIDHGTGEVTLQLTGRSKRRLNDDTWHRIDIFRDKKNVRMVVDHCINSVRNGSVEDRSDCEASGYTRGENIYLNVAQVLQLGGVLSTPSYPANIMGDKFTGCMRNLVHNAEVYDLSTGGQFPGSQDGCPREDAACGEAGCGNGQCEATGVAGSQLIGTCVCKPGWRTSPSQKCDTEVTELSLKTQSFVDWQLLATFSAALNPRQMALHFSFRTRDDAGKVFSITDASDSSKYIKSKIEGGRLLVSYNLGDGEIIIQLSNVQVSNGQYHNVTLERYGKEFMLKLDSGEGRYYAESLGPVNGMMEFKTRQDQIHSGANVLYTSGQGVFSGEDLVSTCLKDFRYDNKWFPLSDAEESQSPAAMVVQLANTEQGCKRDDCTNRCSPPFVCVPLWEDFSCQCPEHYEKNNNQCLVIDYCSRDSPCIGGTCLNNVPPKAGEQPFK
ncbi:hypothetical protein DPMN_007529, partial [Dreissena polymorpha]